MLSIDSLAHILSLSTAFVCQFLLTPPEKPPVSRFLWESEFSLSTRVVTVAPPRLVFFRGNYKKIKSSLTVKIHWHRPCSHSRAGEHKVTLSKGHNTRSPEGG